MQFLGMVHTGQNPPITLVKRLCSGVSAIYVASLGKHNLTKLFRQFKSKPVEKTFSSGSNTTVRAL
jgi:hypothetical protein